MKLETRHTLEETIFLLSTSANQSSMHIASL